MRDVSDESSVRARAFASLMLSLFALMIRSRG